jgi:alpha-L-fucosidase
MDYQTRMQWFNEARFGMFVHWGLYSLLERGEWVMYAERIPAKEYHKLIHRFTPPKSFKVDSWVKLARQAGMKYMVLTSRHHDGFCLFDSKVSDFTSTRSPAKRDFIAEYVEACRRNDMRVGIYYSLLDWRFPGYYDKEKYPESFSQMVEQVHQQVRELMTNYGKIDVLWYDGGWITGVDSKDLAACWQSEKLNRMVRQLQPEIIINNRSGVDEDTDTPEQHVTASAAGRCWESCMTIGDAVGWGYVRNQPNIKTLPQLTQYLVTAASEGGNYLLNIGPKADGSVQPEYRRLLGKMGKWTQKNGASIYGSERVNTFTPGIIGMTTMRGSKLYIHVFRWPGETAVIPGIANTVYSARILADGRKIKFRKTKDGKVILSQMPKDPPDRCDTVIELEMDGPHRYYNASRIPL